MPRSIGRLGACGLHDAFAARAGQLRSNLPDHFEARRHVLQHFRNVFAEMFQLSATVRAGGLLRQILSHFARQMLRQRPTRRFRRDVCNRRNPCRCVRSSCVLRLRGLQARPAATPVARSDGPASPTCARTASAAAWRSAASSVRSRCHATTTVRAARGSVLSVRWDRAASRSGSARGAATIAANLADVCYSKIKMGRKTKIILLTPPSAARNCAPAAASRSLPAASTTALG